MSEKTRKILNLSCTIREIQNPLITPNRSPIVVHVHILSSPPTR